MGMDCGVDCIFMWRMYRRRFLVMQLPILIVCIVLRVLYQAPWARIGVFFAVMQLPAVIGAFWASRMQRKMAQVDDGAKLRKS